MAFTDKRGTEHLAFYKKLLIWKGQYIVVYVTTVNVWIKLKILDWIILTKMLTLIAAANTSGDENAAVRAKLMQL